MASSVFDTSFGRCAIEWDGDALTGFTLLASLSKKNSSPTPGWIDAIIGRVQRHLGGEPQDFSDLPYDFSRVTPFRRAVYEAALNVKAGDTRTYGWLAKATGRTTTASRAIGTALGRNPWPLLIPCHRFIGANGKLTGFSAPGGTATKHRLLVLERAELCAI